MNKIIYIFIILFVCCSLLNYSSSDETVINTTHNASTSVSDTSESPSVSEQTEKADQTRAKKQAKKITVTTRKLEVYDKVKRSRELKDLAQEISELSADDLKVLNKHLKSHYLIITEYVKNINPINTQKTMGQTEQPASTSQTGVRKENVQIELTAFGDRKINVIKEVRAITGAGLKEAKDLVESAPVVIIKNIPADKAEEIKQALEKAGATVSIK